MHEFLLKYSLEGDILEPRQEQLLMIETFEGQVQNKTDDVESQWKPDDVKPPDIGKCA